MSSSSWLSSVRECVNCDARFLREGPLANASKNGVWCMECDSEMTGSALKRVSAHSRNSTMTGTSSAWDWTRPVSEPVFGSEAASTPTQTASQVAGVSGHEAPNRRTAASGPRKKAGERVGGSRPFTPKWIFGKVAAGDWLPNFGESATECEAKVESTGEERLKVEDDQIGSDDKPVEDARPADTTAEEK